MPAKKYKVTLTKVERDELAQFVNVGKGQAARLKRARILLMADEAQNDG
ncbi:MAG: IS630 family transposase, partial [Chloroflexi bacterium]|nr:IS630 family transposase [Chloroflexota bacterium]